MNRSFEGERDELSELMQEKKQIFASSRPHERHLYFYSAGRETELNELNPQSCKVLIKLVDIQSTESRLHHGGDASARCSSEKRSHTCSVPFLLTLSPLNSDSHHASVRVFCCWQSIRKSLLHLFLYYLFISSVSCAAVNINQRRRARRSYKRQDRQPRS